MCHFGICRLLFWHKKMYELWRLSAANGPRKQYLNSYWELDIQVGDSFYSQTVTTQIRDKILLDSLRAGQQTSSPTEIARTFRQLSTLASRDAEAAEEAYLNLQPHLEERGGSVYVFLQQNEAVIGLLPRVSVRPIEREQDMLPIPNCETHEEQTIPLLGCVCKANNGTSFREVHKSMPSRWLELRKVGVLQGPTAAPAANAASDPGKSTGSVASRRRRTSPSRAGSRGTEEG
ncbi:hypothetical protein B0H17DRAFT_1141491 [Mycena rosella]|uniref:Uncharacterized protein n=1 Tax=Mycena rosella TaxID=1033263 RepID=A0AAD7CZL2_MYCRO|nr:hypothetical protein B0H17DRAFT_1141491 [Mycena rosella]